MSGVEEEGRAAPIFSFINDGQWAPIRSTDSAADSARGRAYAIEMLSVIRREGNPALFGAVVRAITQGGVYSAVEAGFCSIIGMTIMVEP